MVKNTEKNKDNGYCSQSFATELDWKNMAARQALCYQIELPISEPPDGRCRRCPDCLPTSTFHALLDKHSDAASECLFSYIHHHHHQNAWAADARSAVLVGWKCPGDVQLQASPILGGWRLRNHHQSGAAKSALDVRVVFSSPTEGVSRYSEHRHTQGHL